MINFDSDSVICATATPSGVGGIAVIRVCGESSEKIVRKLCGFLPKELESHKIYYGFLCDTASGDAIDEVLVSYFEQGKSFTGNPVFEISCHGGQFITKQVLEQLVHSGARLAEPGEFSYRAFVNGRIDLVQAESILSLIESGSKKQSKISLEQLKGHLSKSIHEIADELTFILANLEANIDFSQEDIELVSASEFLTQVESVCSRLKVFIESYSSGKKIKEGINFALVGLPNAGKSSFLNELVGFEKAIVTDIPGTTRDVVEASFFMSGVQLNFFDTAGVHETSDVVEKLGIDRSIQTLKDCDYVIYIHDASLGLVKQQKLEGVFCHLEPEKCVYVNCKSDLLGNEGLYISNQSQFNEVYDQFSHLSWLKYFKVSNKTGDGFEDLKNWFDLLTQLNFVDHSAVVIQARHYELLTTCLEKLLISKELMVADESPEFIAVEMQLALRAIYEILGKTYDDQVMDKVFKQFCIGK